MPIEDTPPVDRPHTFEGMDASTPVPPEGSIAGDEGLPRIDPRWQGRVLIKLDGRMVHSCVAYSVPQGFVVCHVGNGRGMLVIGEGKDARVATFKAEGRVEVFDKAAPTATVGRETAR